MRTTAIGWWTPATGVTPGIRRPVRMITLPSICLAQDLVRAADVVGALGRDRRGLDARSRPRASPAAAATHDLVLGPAPVLEREVVVLEARASTPQTAGSSSRSACSSSSWPVWSPSRTIMRGGVRHRARIYPADGLRPDEPGPLRVHVVRQPGRADDGFRLAEHAGDRGAVFCRLEHVVPWAIQGAHWEAGEPLEPPGDRRRPRLRPLRRRAGRRARACSSATGASTGSPTASARSTTCSSGRRRAGRWGTPARSAGRHPAAVTLGGGSSQRTAANGRFMIRQAAASAPGSTGRARRDGQVRNRRRVSALRHGRAGRQQERRAADPRGLAC